MFFIFLAIFVCRICLLFIFVPFCTSIFLSVFIHESVWLQCWLDHEKPIIKQVSTQGLLFKFLVKFYTPDPGLLEEEYTRWGLLYLFI